MTSFDQAVLYLAWILHVFTFEQLGRHFSVSTDRARAYATETADVLPAQAPDLAQGLRATGSDRHAVLDGTLIATDRCASARAGYTGPNQDPYYSGKHHRHGVNVQGLIGLDGQLLFPTRQTGHRARQRPQTVFTSVLWVTVPGMGRAGKARKSAVNDKRSSNPRKSAGGRPTRRTWSRSCAPEPAANVASCSNARRLPHEYR